MKIFILFLFLFITNYSIAQIDSIEHEIMNYQNSDLETISKARRLMTDKLNQGDYSKMKEIKDYLIYKIDAKEYSIFSENEYWLILFWTQEYDELLKSIEKIIVNFDNNVSYYSANQGFQIPDNLYKNLIDKSLESSNLLQILINNADIDSEDKDFLNLHLNYCLFNSNYSNITQDSLNILADMFSFRYPASPYRPFVKKVIQYKIKVSDFSLSYDFFIGYGFFTGGISKSFNDYVPFGFSVDLNLKNFNLNMGIGLGVSTLEQTIVYKNISWEKEMKADIYYPHACVGYTFFGSKRINFNPFAGISSIFITPDYEDIQYSPQLENIQLRSEISPMFGLSINFYSASSIFSGLSMRPYRFQGFVKLKYTYFQSGYSKDFYGLDGQMHTICLSFGGLMRHVYRL